MLEKFNSVFASFFFILVAPNFGKSKKNENAVLCVSLNLEKIKKELTIIFPVASNHSRISLSLRFSVCLCILYVHSMRTAIVNII